MSEFDPNILRRNLPEDIHALVDQVNANVNLAVDKIVGDFKEKANATAEQFARHDFSPALKSELESIKRQYQDDLDGLQSSMKKLAEAADAANAAANAANAASLAAALDRLKGQTGGLTDELTRFRHKVDRMAELTSGVIAKAAVKTFTGGIG